MACEGSFGTTTGQGVLFDVPRISLKHKNLHSPKIEEIDFFNVKRNCLKIGPDSLRELDFQQIAFYVENCISSILGECRFLCFKLIIGASNNTP